ncbi:PTS lactose/cellobiose transporter subunit IIA [Pectobacterium polaris]|uniref:PTS lactose/cellobiose transporter subunit IIA n=1 Tax=Pectobacterium polaris TaxID=2042057 RepID=UPI0023AE7DA6|nr:PTS lactose/cellobiose transporter subunit IIA [Pectobacterium polaris]MDE8743547.1 PTS lactose/cellobiose transporter subunit IIA [Pectobacterium polaris]
MRDETMLDETTVMELIIYAGEARSSSMEALSAASVAARKAHQIQTALIGADEGSGKIPVNLILVHAQDHLMNAMLCRELVEELIQLHREISTLKQLIN